MRPSHLTHTLEKDRDSVHLSVPSESLALVDVESYPAFIGKKADYFDLMAHLSAQMQALTILPWKAPDHALKLELLLAENDLIIERTQAHRVMIASGNVRTYGQLCLVTHEQLFDSARQRTRGLLRDSRPPKNARPRLLHVPPGIYAISVYYHTSYPHENWSPEIAEATPKADYTVLLRRYPFPPPRVAPIRLSNSFFARAGELAARTDEVITSHWKWGKLPSS